MASKYDPLGRYLAETRAAEVPLSFLEIEKIIGQPLPEKSAKHPAWWSNNTSNSTMTQVWLDAGYRTERVEIGRRRLVFRRVGRDNGGVQKSAPASFVARAAPNVGGLLARVRAALAGTVCIPKGVDLTAPVDERWDAEAS